MKQDEWDITKPPFPLHFLFRFWIALVEDLRSGGWSVHVKKCENAEIDGGGAERENGEKTEAERFQIETE